MLRTARISVNGLILTLRELTGITAEALTVGATAPALLTKEILTTAIVAVNNAPMDEKEIHERLPLARHWSAIARAYGKLIDQEGIERQIKAIRKAIKLDPSQVLVTLSTGANILLRPLSADEDERIDLEAEDASSAIYDKTAAGIAAIDGNPVNRDTFDARVHFERAADWMLLSLAYAALNTVESVPDFLPETPGAPNGSGNSPITHATATNPTST